MTTQTIETSLVIPKVMVTSTIEATSTATTTAFADFHQILVPFALSVVATVTHSINVIAKHGTINLNNVLNLKRR